MCFRRKETPLRTKKTQAISNFVFDNDNDNDNDNDYDLVNINFIQ